MIIKMLEPSTLKGYEKNARTHSLEQITQLCESIKAFGFNTPVEVSRDLMILSGHARVKASIKLNLKQIPVIIHEHLAEEITQKGYVLAANKIAMNAGWDYDLLTQEIAELEHAPHFDMQATGFTTIEIDELLGKMDFDPGNVGEQGALDLLEPKHVVCPHCEKQFNLRDLD